MRKSEDFKSKKVREYRDIVVSKIDKSELKSNMNTDIVTV